MAGRIRTIKPELITIERFAKCSDPAARLFIGVYSLVDDRGNCPAGPQFLSGQIFYARPRGATVLGRILAELEAARLVDLYRVDGAQYLSIVGWSEKGSPTHQRIDKPQPPRYPVPKSVRSWNEFQERSQTEEIRSEPTASGAEGDRSAVRETLSHADHYAGWTPAGSVENGEACDPAQERGVDLDFALQKFRDYARARALPRAQLDAAWRRWIQNEKPPPRAEQRSYHPVAEIESPPGHIALVFGERVGDPKYPEDDPSQMEAWNRYVLKNDNGLWRPATEQEEQAAVDAECARWDKQMARRANR